MHPSVCSDDDIASKIRINDYRNMTTVVSILLSVCIFIVTGERKGSKRWGGGNCHRTHTLDVGSFYRPKP